jgi:beta-galactosidase
MELQPGQVNWGAVNPQPYPGAVRMWILRSFAAGAKILCTYRYRQALFSSELYHYGIVGPDGVTLSSGGEEYRQAMKEIRSLRQQYDPKRRAPSAYTARAAGLLFRYDNRWDIDNHKQNKRWDTTSHVLKYYRALKALGAPVDVITQEKDFGKYPFLIAPAYQLIDRALVDRLRDYVEAGGHLVLSCRSGQKDRQGHLWESQWAAPIRDLIGARIQFYDTLPEPWKAEVKVGEKRFSWRTWGDILKPDAGTKILATYAGQFYSGSAAAVNRKLGKGTVTYIGVDSEDGRLERALVRGAYLAAGMPVLDLAEGMFVDWRDGFWVATNFSSTTQKAPLTLPAKLLMGTADVKPAGVTVWVE